MGADTKIAAALVRYGRPMLLRRRVTAPDGFVEVTVNGITDNYKAVELIGGLVQGDRKVTISNREIAAAGWPGPPRKSDQIRIDGVTTTVQGCETKYLGEVVLAHVLWVRG
jgi:hypothetical protein